MLTRTVTMPICHSLSLEAGFENTELKRVHIFLATVSSSLCQYLQVTSSLDLQCLTWDFPEWESLNEQYQELGARRLISFVWATTGDAHTIALCFWRASSIKKPKCPARCLGTSFQPPNSSCFSQMYLISICVWIFQEQLD